MRGLVGAVALAMLAAGCGGSGAAGGASRADGPPEVHPSWRSCDAEKRSDGIEAGTEPFGLPLLGDDFAPVAVTVCGTGPASAPAGGESLVATERRAGSVHALVVALRLPDEPPADGACTLDLVTMPWFALHDAQGRWVRPGVPTDACGKPRREVREAFDALTFETVSSRKVGEITSSGAAAADCSQRWADMVDVQSRFGGTAAPPAGYAPPADAPVRACVYRVPPGERGSAKPAGDFTAGGALTAGEWAAIRRALPSGTPAKPCDTPADRFAVLSTGGAGEVYVELDGCRRVLSSTGGGLLQGTPALTAALDRAVAG
jgi:hypothetical protein